MWQVSEDDCRQTRVAKDSELPATAVEAREMTPCQVRVSRERPIVRKKRHSHLTLCYTIPQLVSNTFSGTLDFRESSMKYVLAIALALSLTNLGAAAAVDLTGDLWDIDAIDLAGYDWGASSLLFESQTPSGANFC